MCRFLKFSYNVKAKPVFCNVAYIHVSLNDIHTRKVRDNKLLYVHVVLYNIE